MTQLALDIEPPRENPNAWMFHPDGTMKLLLWPADDLSYAHRHGLPCPRPVSCPACNPVAFACTYGCCPPQVGGP